MLFVNWTSERFRISFILLLYMSAVSSSFKPTANNPRRFDKPWQLMTGYGNIAKNQARRLLCSVWCPKKKIIKPCSASRMTFRAWFYRTDPQNIGGQFGTLSGFLRNTFRKRPSQRKPRNIFQSEKFQDYFSETSTSLLSLFLGGSAFRLGYIYILSKTKSICYKTSQILWYQCQRSIKRH